MKTPKRRKAKPDKDQLRRFIERAEEIGAEATEEEFEQVARKIVTSKPPKKGKDG